MKIKRPKVKRSSINIRLRFEVLKRDGFKCVYCGAKPQYAELHVDHVHAIANGGVHNDTTNLVTACATCNIGKSAIPLDRIITITHTPVFTTMPGWSIEHRGPAIRIYRPTEADT